MVGAFCGTGGVRTSRFLRLFSANAGGALIQDRIHVGEARDPGDMFVGVVEVVVTGVAEALMPKETLCFGFDVMDGDVGMGEVW